MSVIAPGEWLTLDCVSARLSRALTRQESPPMSPSHSHLLPVLLGILLLALPGCLRTGGAGPDDDDTSGDDDSSGSVTVEEQGDDFRCTPAGEGPFPGVLYNHGGMGDQVGGDLEGTCRGLAEAGYVAYSKKRRDSIPLNGHLDDVFDGLEGLQTSPGVDESRLAIVGFSRGGLLTLQAALMAPELWDAVVLMAPAPGNNSMDETLQDVSPLAAPVLIQVAENDLFQANHVQIVADVMDAFDAAGKDYTSYLYPPYGDDGHELFWEVQDPYWSDLLDFLADKL